MAEQDAAPLTISKPPQAPDLDLPVTRQYEDEKARLSALDRQTDYMVKAREAGGAGAAAQRFADTQRTLAAPLMAAQVPQRPNIDKDTQEGLIGLAALLPMAGMLIGSKGMMAGTNAMNAMAGLLNGYSKGNADRIAFERQRYDDHMKEFNAQMQLVREKLTEATKIAQTDYQAGVDFAKKSAYELGASNLATMVDKMGLVGALGAAAKIEQAAKLKAAQAQAVGGSGGGSAAELRYSFNITEAMGQVAQDVENIAMFPKGTVLGTFAGMIGQAGTGLVSSLENTFARAVTPEETRAMQQIVSGIESNLARALGGGYAQSGAAHVVDQYKQQVARSGDSPAAQAMFLARIKQEMRILAENMSERPGASRFVGNIKAYSDQINKSVPFDVKDVLAAVLKKDGSQETKVATPKTKEEFDALPAGTLYIDPVSGKKFRK